MIVSEKPPPRKMLLSKVGRPLVKRVNSEPGVICWQLLGVFLPNFSKPPSSFNGSADVGQGIHLIQLPGLV